MAPLNNEASLDQAVKGSSEKAVLEYLGLRLVSGQSSSPRHQLAGHRQGHTEERDGVSESIELQS